MFAPSAAPECGHRAYTPGRKAIAPVACRRRLPGAGAPRHCGRAESLSSALLGVHLEDRISKYNVPEFLKAKLNMGEGLVENFVDGSFYSSFAVNDHLNELKENFAVIFQDRIYEAAYYWSKICLSNYILVGLGDKLEMAHSIEGRVPFLDTFLVESVNHLPLDLKMQGKKEKQILRNELVDTVIPSILKRTKHPLLANPSIADCQAFIVQELERLCSYDLPYFSRNKLQKFLIQIANDRFKEREFSQLIIVLSVLYLYETLIIN
ncbi:MAG: asparagine synthase-related protein [Spirochaetota bacterium]